MKLDPPEVLAARECLERNLETLQFYCCNRGSFPRDGAGNSFLYQMILRGIFRHGNSYWPESALLLEIEASVQVLALRERKKNAFPAWKAFQQVDKRMPKLRLKKRVDDLITRARALLSSAQLSKLVTQADTGDIQARCRLREKIIKTEKFAELFQAALQPLPLARWIVSIGHPTWKDFACITGTKPLNPDVWRRFLQSERVLRHRAKKNL